MRSLRDRVARLERRLGPPPPPPAPLTAQGRAFAHELQRLLAAHGYDLDALYATRVATAGPVRSAVEFWTWLREVTAGNLPLCLAVGQLLQRYIANTQTPDHDPGGLQPDA